MLYQVHQELKRHAPFTALGSLSGIAIMIALSLAGIPRSVSERLFWTLHPAHVLLSALVTTAMYVLHARRSMWSVLWIGYVGSVGIATLSDSLIPFVGEWMLGLPHRAVHLGFIEKWWLVNPLALAGILIGALWPHTKISHAGHVLLSTWASLFHVTMAMDERTTVLMILPVAVFLFLAVWVPCCTSDIVFPMLFVRTSRAPHATRHAESVTGQKGKAA
jgi:hypothetical protein